MAEGRRIIKKVVGGHGHHGGAWKVAYADFVTAMMALFMVMWLLASTDAASRKEISNYFRTGVLPDGNLSPNRASQIKPSLIEASSSPPPAGEESMDPRSEAAEEIAGQLAAIAQADATLANMMKNVHISITPEGVLIDAVDGDGMLFEVASSALRPALQHFVETVAPMVAKLGRPVEINGHTDARPYVNGSRMSNWDLSYQRASVARELLVEHGVAEDHVHGVFARGSSQLYVPNDPYAAQNRRLSFLIKIAKPADTKLAANEK